MALAQKEPMDDGGSQTTVWLRIKTGPREKRPVIQQNGQMTAVSPIKIIDHTSIFGAFGPKLPFALYPSNVRFVPKSTRCNLNSKIDLKAEYGIVNPQRSLILETFTIQ